MTMDTSDDFTKNIERCQGLVYMRSAMEVKTPRSSVRGMGGNNASNVHQTWDANVCDHSRMPFYSLILISCCCTFRSIGTTKCIMEIQKSSEAMKLAQV
ncbi:hypothetical protein IEQ34_008160 [Dendrobium chrysotoxum]|uniref:Uncharacterized protein n=1 Tax=Dendrobium chrysotoxum TaxID=161865 RepID=A0AAV7H7U3_DENCH|nr:hypothetical protein IEQ34_008160 [Dendrobium chrysotoxum]